MESGTGDITVREPLVSVIVGTKDRPLLIMRAIRTILAQTYPNFECLIVDSGTSAETEALVKEIKDKRISYYKLLPDPGRVESLNFGISKSKGEYITFLDDDDEYLPGKLEKQARALHDSDDIVGMAYCWSMFYDEGNEKKLYDLKNDIRGYVFTNALEYMAFCSFPALMLKRKPLIETGLTDEANYPSDWLFVARFTKKYHVVDVPEVLVKANINHIYDRMSVPREKDKDYYTRIKNFHIHFYTLFKADYIKIPRKAMIHLYPIITVSAILKNYREWFIYSAEAIRLGPLNLKTYQKIIKSSYHALIPFTR